MSGSKDRTLVVCRVGDRLLGVRLDEVERVERAVEIIPLPQAPAGLCGLVNFHGEPVAVLDPRPALGLEPRNAPELSDQLVLLKVRGSARARHGALLVDETLGVVLPSDQFQPQPAHDLVAGLQEEDEIVIVGEQLVIVRSDGVLMPPVLLEAAADGITDSEESS